MKHATCKWKLMIPWIRNRRKQRKERPCTLGRKTTLAQNKSKSRLKETPQQNESRLQNDRTQNQPVRFSETVEKKQDRLKCRRSKYVGSRSSKNAEQSFNRQQIDRTSYVMLTSKTFRGLENAAFNYDPETKYDQHPAVSVGRIDTICLFCRALKWKGETPEKKHFLYAF